ncbi:nuclease [Vibrio sp. vnigr-6D03]|uniref:ExeM/NucH family extracellular endonuclease n=1 Tax=Vibrio sp. vnigr-6D03 TaxID=2058088 RepID=UPI000C33709B|nr:ExeM/NucH family extracellular endonuclease [Vibrio sp. vnigr-6D03]PKF77829.1 nuclease [Vibrio sp. vnigr-6D03]
METKLTRTILALAVSGAFAAPAAADIVLSQYVEGGSFNKAIEIANTSDAAVSLDGFQLAKSTNGGGTWGSRLSLSGKVIAAKDVLVISHASASAAIQAVTDENSSVANFNGDDPIALLNSDDSIHDIIGVMGDVDFAKDKTLVRNSDSMTPSSTYQASQWTVLGKDNIDGLGELDGGTPPVAFNCTVDGQAPNFTSIQDIQGEGETSPFISGYPYITEDEYFVRGVVSAVTTGLTKGFYLQAESDDNNPNTSEGLFVHTGESSIALQPGDVVCARGKVQEFYNHTQLKVEGGKYVKQDESSVPSATEIQIADSDANFDETLERYEGMLVKTSQDLDMRVTRTFGFDYAARRNNMVLAQGRPNTQPNQNNAAGSDGAKAQSEENAQRRLYVESDAKAPNGVIPYYPDFGRTDADQDGSTEDYIRIDDTVIGLEGVIAYSFGDYRLIATNSLTNDNFVHNDPRTEKPTLERGGDLRIATFNVLNYFNSPFGGDSNQHGNNRGASNQGEFDIQEAKIVDAILRLDADIIGLMEIENNGFGQGAAIRQLVEKLNENIDKKRKRYKFVSVDSNADGMTDEMDSVGTDAITTGVIYRSSKVKLKKTRVIPMPRQVAPEVLDDDGKVIEDGKNYQRDSLAPTFKVKGTKHKITVAVNHFKSKGSKCWEDAAPVDQGGQGGADPDKQGSCEAFRVAAAVALGDALDEIKGHKVILGDLNAYGKEDPLLVLTDYSQEKYGKEIKGARNTFIGDSEQFGDNGAVINHNYGYISAVEMKHPNSWSYSFNDEVGALDHLLISKSLKKKVVDATDWHINGGESKLFDYNDEFKGDFPKYQDHFRSSDHDPAVLDLNMSGASAGFASLLALFGLGMWRRRR